MFTSDFLAERKKAILQKKFEYDERLKIAKGDLKEVTATLCEPGDVADASVALNCLDVNTFHVSECGKIRSHIRIALQHLDSNDSQYGICLECSESISKTRLIAIPWAQRCIKCQEIFDNAQENIGKGESGFYFNLAVATHRL